MKLAIPEKERSFELVNSRPNILARKTTKANKGSNRVSFNINAVSTAHAAGYRTGSQPGYWRNPFNPLAGAASSCSSQGGTLGTHSDIREANTAHGTIIPNGTRVIFRAANGDADAYTGSSLSTTKPQ